MESVEQLLNKPEFSRASRYDNAWMLENQMGPNAVWLMDWLCEKVAITPGMRVLDLGCGRAMTSIFVAKEFGAQVWAADLWIGPDNNWRRALDAGVGNLVYPLRAEAHTLPFPKGFFDVVVSVDAYQYFGTDVLYLEYLSGFIKPGGALGVVMPGLTHPFQGEVPVHLTTPQANGKVFWEDECCCFKTAAWWREHWSGYKYVSNIQADTLSDGWRHWRDFEKALELSGKNIFPSDAEALERDGGNYIGFVRITADRTDEESMNLYDAGIGVQFGVDK